MNDKRIRDYLKLFLAALAIIVHVLNKTSLCRKFHVVVAPKDDLEMYQKVRCTCSVVWVFLFAVLWQILTTILSASQRCNTAATLFLIVTTLNEEWSSQLWMQFIQLRKKPEKKIEDFNGFWTGDFAIPVRCSNQLRYEATDAGSWSKNSSCDLPCVGSPKRGWESFDSSFSLLSWMKCSGPRNDAVVRALGSYHCCHGSGFCVCCLLQLSHENLLSWQRTGLVKAFIAVLIWRWKQVRAWEEFFTRIKLIQNITLLLPLTSLFFPFST